MARSAAATAGGASSLRRSRDLAAQPGLLGGELYAQWLEFGAQVAAPQAMRFQIAPRMPNLDMTTLIRHADGTVEIRPRFAPVFGFRCL